MHFLENKLCHALFKQPNNPIEQFLINSKSLAWCFFLPG